MKSFKDINETESDRLMIVDSLNLGFRYAHSGATDFCDEYMQTVSSLAKSYKCSKVIIAGDMGSSSYRKAIYPLYKANRKEKYEKQTAEEAAKFERFFTEMQGILQAYREQGKYPVLAFQGVEADDIAAYIVRKRKKLNNIWLMSSDKDWNLLVDANVSQFSYVTRKEITLGNWGDHHECTPEEYISVKVLQGDSVDNIKGAESIGPKRALQLIQEYGSAYDIAEALPIASKYKYIAKLNEFGADNIYLNYKLMDLVSYCEEAIGQDNCATIDTILGDYLNG